MRAPAKILGGVLPTPVPAALVALALLAGGPALSPPVPFAAPLLAQETEPAGKVVYDKWCSSCHGVEGDGQGPAAEWMLPRPRDFTSGLYQIRTTAGGELPTDDDILHIIDVGMPGTTMPGWENMFSGQERRALVQYLKTFSRFFENGEPPTPVDFGRAPRVTPERIAEGRVFYDSIECWQCHGDAGRGDGTSAPTLEDDRGYPIRAVDLSRNWAFNGGGSVEDIYRRLLTGLDGTPMPAFSDLIDAGFMNEDQLWSLAHYVRSLAPEEVPRTREVVRAGLLLEDALPTTPDDPRWDGVEPFHIPLVGQIIIQPRWFNPRVESVSVRALHDGEELALLVTWSDPSRSPDPAWLPWQERVLGLMEPKDEGAAAPGPHPDRLAVQFPTAIPDGMERPFFLMGNARTPVSVWRWTSLDEEGAGPAATQALARGMHDIQPLAGGGELSGESVYADGQWRVLFRRSLRTEDTTDRIQFTPAQPIPIGFFAWDGDNGETGSQGSIGTWYYIYLEEATPVTVFVFPFIALALTALLGVMVVSRAQKRERAEDERERAGSGPPENEGLFAE